jgi:hypothetical protein
MKFVIEQIALAPRDPGKAMDLLRSLGLNEWVFDDVTAVGKVKVGDMVFENATNKATLRFNYQAAPEPLAGAAKPLELEVIDYNNGFNFLDDVMGRCGSVASHIAMHCSAEELAAWRKKLGGLGYIPIQDVFTIEHRNPAIAGKRWYNYVIFGTREVIGVDLKFIVRLDQHP